MAEEVVATLAIEVNTKGAQENLRKLTEETKRFEAGSKAVNETTSKFKDTLLRLGAAATAYVGLRELVRQNSDYERSLVRANSAVEILSSTHDQYIADTATLKRNVKSLAYEANASYGEMTAALTKLRIEGRSALESLGDAEAVGALSKITDAPIGELAGQLGELASNYSLGFSGVKELTDVLYITSIRTGSAVQAVGAGLNSLSGIARTTGVDIKDLAAATVALDAAGLGAEQSSNTLKRVLTSLSNPTAQQAEALKALGLNIKDLSVSQRGFIPVVEDLSRAFSRITDGSERFAVAQELLDARSASAFLTLADGITDVKEVRKQYDELSGIVERTAETQDRTLLGSYHRLIAASKSLITVEDGLGGALGNVLGFVATSVGQLAGLSQAQEEATVSTTLFAGALATAAVVVPALHLVETGLKFRDYARGLSAAKEAATGVATGSNVLTKTMSTLWVVARAHPFAAVATAAIALGAGIYSIATSSSQAERELKRLNEVAKDLPMVAQTFEDINRAKRESILPEQDKEIRSLEQKIQLYDSFKTKIAEVANESQFGVGFFTEQDLLPLFSQEDINRMFKATDASEAIKKMDLAGALDQAMREAVGRTGGGQNAVPITFSLLGEGIDLEIKELRDRIEELMKGEEPVELPPLDVSAYLTSVRESGKDTKDATESAQAYVDKLKMQAELMRLTANEQELLNATFETFAVSIKNGLTPAQALANVQAARGAVLTKQQIEASKERIEQLLREKEVVEEARKSGEKAIDSYIESIQQEHAFQKLSEEDRKRALAVARLEELAAAANIELTDARRASLMKLLDEMQNYELMQSAAAAVDERRTTAQEILSKYEQAETEAAASRREDAKVHLADMEAQLALGSDLLFMAEDEKTIRREMLEYTQALKNAEDEASETKAKTHEESLRAQRRISDYELLVVQGAQQSVTALGDVLFEAKSAGEAVEGLIRSISRMVFEQYAGKQIMASIIGAFAPTKETRHGGVFDDGVRQHSRGGIIDRLSHFKTADGAMNSVSEDNAPEVIMPVTKMSSGNYGVAVSGGGRGGSNITMNIYTPNAESFRRAQRSIERDQMKASRRAGR